MRKSEAIHLRGVIEQSAQFLSDETALTAVKLYPVWTEIGIYDAGIRVHYNGILYRCLISHAAQSDWTPDAASSLWAKVLIPDGSTIPVWEQPDSTNPYMKGDRVIHNGNIWVSVLDNNTWEPGVHGWEKED